MYISLWENYRGHPDNISFMQFSTKIDGFEQKDWQGFENSYNSYEQYPLEKKINFHHLPKLYFGFNRIYWWSTVMAARCIHHCPAKPHLHPDRGRQTYPQPNQTKQEAKANQNQTVSHNYHNFIAVSSGGVNITPGKSHPFCFCLP